MIGWYIHHVGHGHLQRAVAVARHLDGQVTGLSSLSRPADWPGEWVRLVPDSDGDTAKQPSAGGVLHWAPLGHDGLRTRMAAVSAWVEAARPEVVVVDVSVEIALLVRLHGIPVVTMAMPGDRGDAAHRLAYQISSGVLAAWPADVPHVVRGVATQILDRMHCVGAISRFPVAVDDCGAAPRTVAALFGSGGDDAGDGWLDDARKRTPTWSWTVLGGTEGSWVQDPWPRIRASSVVVTHAGQNAVAEVAASRRPAVVVPQARPYGEQEATAHALRDPRWPAEVVDPARVRDWPALLDRVSALDGLAWSGWCDGHAAARAAAVVRGASLPAGPRAPG